MLLFDANAIINYRNVHLGLLIPDHNGYLTFSIGELNGIQKKIQQYLLQSPKVCLILELAKVEVVCVYLNTLEKCLVLND